MTWIMEKALVRANEYGIEGVDYKKTMGVVKNIIPAIASTNALISAACVNECLKLLTGINKRMDNYMQYLGQTRLSVSTLPYQKKDDCLVCARTAHTILVNTNEKVSGLKARLIDTMQLMNPALNGSKGFLIGAGVFADQVAHKLEMTFRVQHLRIEANNLAMNSLQKHKIVKRQPGPSKDNPSRVLEPLKSRLRVVR